MKSLRGIIVFLLILLCMTPVFAQSNSSDGERSPSGILKSNESEYYYCMIQLEKIYSHSKGYVVVYRRGANRLARALIPHSWFSGPDGKADLIQIGSGTLWPYIAAYYKDGEFSHLRLFVRKERGHVTWGTVPPTANIDQYFEDMEEFKPLF